MRPWLLLAATVVGAARGLQSLPLRRVARSQLPQQHRIVLQTSSPISRHGVHLMSTAAAIAEKDDTATVANLPAKNVGTIHNNRSDSNKLAKELGTAFAERLSELEEYRRAHGHCLVPKRYEGSPALGNWVNKQRQNYRRYARGEKTSMNDKRIAALDRIGFVWDATALPQRSGHSDAAWQRDRLVLFHAENGHCRVPSTSPLGQWVVRQRFLYRQQPSGRPKSSLTAERIHLLNRLDFPWTTRSEQLWQERISDLRQFQEEHGHAMVPRTYVPNPQLSAWVATQRKNYHRRKNGKASPLTAGRIEELEGMGFVWSYWDYNFIRANGGAE